MALPEDRLSTTAQPDDFDHARALPVTKTTDYESGGIALDDASEGLLYQTWRARILQDENDINLRHIVVDAEDVEPFTVHSAQDITEVSITFDRNMRLHYAWVEGGDAFFHWYDSQAAAMVTTNFGSGMQNPRITHDDKRPLQDSPSDIILAYITGNTLMHRRQRDRFDTEIELAAELPDTAELIKIGMLKNLRLGFMVRDLTVDTPLELPDVEVEDPDHDPEQEPVPDNVELNTTRLANWPSQEPTNSQLQITIPGGKILAEEFTTTSDSDLRGQFSYETPAGEPTPTTEVWFSRSPGGPALDDFHAHQEGSHLYSIRWYQSDSQRGASLTPNATYYLNQRTKSGAESTVWRWLTSNSV